MRKQWLHRFVYIVLGLCWLIHILLVWQYRFVPSNDYPEWLYQANIIAHYTDHEYNFSQWYKLIIAPVPNGGFVLPLVVLLRILPLQVAGKVLLTLFMLAFPLSVRYYFRSLGNTSPLWLVSVLLLFNISFLNGNFAFLFGCCLLLAAIAFVENVNMQFTPRNTVLTVLFSLLLFFAHAFCALVFLCYLCLLLIGPSSGPVVKNTAIVCIGVIAGLGLVYYIQCAPGDIAARFSWGLDLRYRVSVLTKSFTAGIAFPPYEFSLARTVCNVLFVLFVAALGVLSLRPVLSRFRLSQTAKLALMVSVFAVVSPRYLLGIGEPSQRFALIGFLLLAGFIAGERFHSVLLSSLFLLAMFVTTVRIFDYASAATVLERRFDFLEQYLPPHPNVLTLDDDLGAGAVPSYHVIPKGINFIFQTDYHLMTGGYQPLLFRTGYVVSHDDFMSRMSTLIRERRANGFLALHGPDIPLDIRYVVLDTSTGWGQQMISQLGPEFTVVAEKEIARGVRTVLLARFLAPTQ